MNTGFSIKIRTERNRSLFFSFGYLYVCMYTVYSIRLVCTLYKCTVCNTGSTLLYFLILQYLISLRSDFFAWFPLYIFYVGIFLSEVSPVILRYYYLFLSCWRLFFNLLQHLSLCSLFFLRSSSSLAADIFILHSKIFFATVSYLLLISANTVVSSLILQVLPQYLLTAGFDTTWERTLGDINDYFGRCVTII